MPDAIELRVNGAVHRLETDAARPLLDVLREDLGLTGSKYGCGEGECGACTVLVDGEPRRSCVTAVGTVAGRGITTVEGLTTDGKLHGVQETFLAENAFQCGYCTPGMIVGLAGLLAQKPVLSDAQVLTRMEGHLCRCCGYPNILKAIRRATARARQGS